MKEFLEKLKLIQHLETELNINRKDFVDKLYNQVDKGDIGFLLDLFDVFSSSKNDYKGHVGYDGFKIRKKKRFLDMNINTAVAKGKYHQKDDVLLITAEINGFKGIMIPFYIFLPIFYSIFFVTFLFTDKVNGGMEIFALLFIIFHAALMMGIPYLFMRRSVKLLKRELEREFYFLTKEDSSTQ